MQEQTIFVINPNSTQAVTDAFDAALNALRLPGGPRIRCLTLRDGPPGIQTQMDVESVTLPLANWVRSLDREHGAAAAAYVLACFSDPGLHVVREATHKPVLGISECGMLTAMTLGQRIGVIAILKQSLSRHARMFGAMGLSARLAGELPLELGVVELSNADRTRERLLSVGRRLRDECQADVVVLGCAGMAAYRDWLQAELDLPVVEPTQAATATALGRVLMNWHAPRSV